MIALQDDIYKPRGGSASMFGWVLDCLKNGGQHEALHDGPAGTGKSRVSMEIIAYICETYPGTRVLMGRKTRASMTETTLATWEQLVLPEGHPALRGATRAGRRKYVFENGSEVIVMGFDDPERIKSLEVDLIYVNEANELTLNDWEIAITRLRGGKLPAKFALSDCNPDVPRHWLMNRVRSGVMHRFIGRHKDNPRYYDHDAGDWTDEGRQYVMGTLHNLTGVRRRRLLDGEWCAAEGQIYEMFDSAVHLVNAEDVPGYNPSPDPSKGEKHWNFDWTLMTIDWGTRSPGVLQGWGIIDGRAYRFYEQYRVGGEMRRVGYGAENARTDEEKVDHDFPIHSWWADRASELAAQIDPICVVCDTDRPKAMKLLNDRLSEGMGRTAVVARPVEKKKLGKKGWLLDGIDLVRERMLPGPDGRPSIYLVRGALVAPDPELVAQEKPTCTEDEIPEYVWRQSVDGRPIAEEPDPTCADHGCDAMRFMAAYVWGKDYKKVVVPERPRTLLSPIEDIVKSRWDFLNQDD